MLLRLAEEVTARCAALVGPEVAAMLAAQAAWLASVDAKDPRHQDGTDAPATI